jgi:hypothetical protein
MGTQETSSAPERRKRQRVRLARLEADMAYFQARLEIIGEPTSVNQMAQRKVFRLLHKSVAANVLASKRQVAETA